MKRTIRITHLFFFGNYKLIDGERDGCHVCKGFLSLARLKKSKKGWSLKDFVNDCECVTGDWGKIDIPSLINIEGFYFFKSYGNYIAQGYEYTYQHYLNTETYKPVLLPIEGADNEGAFPEGSEEIFSYNTYADFKKVNGKLLAILKTEGTKLDEKTKKIVTVDEEVIYEYNPRKLIFEKQK